MHVWLENSELDRLGKRRVRALGDGGAARDVEIGCATLIKVVWISGLYPTG
jgi:hypothetical protein